MSAIRPNRDGTVVGYTGVEQVKRYFGDNIVQMYLPPVGGKTQPIEAGYRANAWMFVRHTDYDELRKMMDVIGNTLKMWAE